MKIHILYCWIIIAILGGIASFTTPANSQTVLKRYVQAGGGILRSTTANYILSGTFGETIVGRFSQGTQGFWTSLLFPNSVHEADDILPSLITAKPNPTSSSTSIQFSIASESQVTVTIIDALGRIVRTFSEENYSAGTYQTAWDAKNADGTQSSSGVYQCAVTVRPTGSSQFYTNRTSIILIR